MADQARDATETLPAIGADVRCPFDRMAFFQHRDHAWQTHRAVLDLTDPFHFVETRNVGGCFQERNTWFQESRSRHVDGFLIVVHLSASRSLR